MFASRLTSFPGVVNHQPFINIIFVHTRHDNGICRKPLAAHCTNTCQLTQRLMQALQILQQTHMSKRFLHHICVTHMTWRAVRKLTQHQHCLVSSATRLCDLICFPTIGNTYTLTGEAYGLMRRAGDLLAVYASHHLSMDAQDGNLTPTPKACTQFHSCYMAMDPFWRKLLQLLECNHIGLPLQATACGFNMLYTVAVTD